MKGLRYIIGLWPWVWLLTILQLVMVTEGTEPYRAWLYITAVTWALTDTAIGVYHLSKGDVERREGFFGTGGSDGFSDDGFDVFDSDTD